MYFENKGMNWKEQRLENKNINLEREIANVTSNVKDANTVNS